MSLPELFSNDLGQKYWSTVYAQEVHCNVFQKYQNGNNAGLALIADANGFGTWLPLTGSGGTGGLITVTGGTGINVTELAGNFTVTNEGVVSVTGGTGITVSGLTGAVTISGTGVLAVTGATGILVSGGLGNEIVTNIGVVSVTGGTGITVSGSTGAVVIFTQDISGVTNTDVSIAITQSGSQASVQATGQFPATTNQLILGTTNKITINSTAPASSHTYLLADPLQNAVFMAYTGTSGSSGTMTTLLGPYIKQDPTNGNEFLGNNAGHSGNLQSVAIGQNALSSAVSGTGSVAIGFNTLEYFTFGNSSSGTGAFNTAVGGYAGQFEGGSNNTYIGYQCGQGISGGTGNNNNIALGAFCLNGMNNATGNNALGVNALQNVGTGSFNSALGGGALQQVINGVHHVGIGYVAGATNSTSSTLFSGGVGITGGTGCVLLGNGTGVNSPNPINRISLGYGVVNTTDNTGLIGNSSFTDISSKSTTCFLGNTTPFAGIVLVSTGNSGSTALSYYEEATQANTYTGIWASAQNVTLTYTRVGRQVTISFPVATATANTASSISLGTAIPTRFRPGTAQTFSNMSVEDNGISNLAGYVIINANGTISIFSNAVSSAQVLIANFKGTGTSGLSEPFSVTYQVSV